MAISLLKFVSRLAPQSKAPRNPGKNKGKQKSPDARSLKQGRDRATAKIAPTPLAAARPSGNRYPVEALPSSLRNAVEAIERLVQAPAAICAQSVLAAASLSVSRIAKVQTLLRGKEVFVADYFVTVAQSGERKSAADGLACKGISDLVELEFKRHEKELAVFEAELASVARGEPKPDRPRLSMFFVTEPTLEGAMKSIARGAGFLGWFTDEGAQFFGGYSMSKEKRAKTSGAVSKLWDGAMVVQPRSGRDDDVIVPPCPTTMNIMFQPILLPDSYGDELLAGQGMLARMLPAWPPSNMGTRFFRDPVREDERSVTAFQERTGSLLAAAMEMRVEPGVLSLSDRAFEICRHFHDRIEAQLGAGGELLDVSGFAAKAAEHACRLAGTMTLFENEHATSVDAEIMEGACTLMEFYLSEYKHLRAAALSDTNVNNTQILLEWLIERVGPGKAFCKEPLQQYGPMATRRAAKLKPALALLEQNGWIERLPSGTKVDGKARREPYRLHPLAGVS